MRFSVAAVALALPVAAPVHAIPPEAQQSLTGWALFKVVGQDRAIYRVYVHATVSDGYAVGPRFSTAGVRVAKCAADGRCGPEKRYWTPLKAGQHDIRDEKKWSVRLSAFGKPFAVTWTGPGPTPGTVPVAWPVGPTDVMVHWGWQATARVTVFGRTCDTDIGGAGRSTTVHLTGRPEPTFDRIPARAPAGVPSSARACRPM